MVNQTTTQPREVCIALVRGDGSAPEMMDVATTIAATAALLCDNIKINFIETPVGWNAYEKFGDTLPEQSLQTILDCGNLFFGGVGNPKFDNTIGVEHPEMKPEKRALLRLRSEMGLLINNRPIIFYPELAGLTNFKPGIIPQDGVRQYWLRFLLEGSYFGQDLVRQASDPAVLWQLGVIPEGQEITGYEDRVAELSYYSRENVEKFMKYAFSQARTLGLPLIVLHKANVLARYKFWCKIAERIAGDFSDVELRLQLIDSANAMLFEPATFEGVIACGNAQGDIITDGAAGALGSMGLMCSSAVNPTTGAAMFESGAGTAPTLKGQNIANPIGRILTGAMMLRHIGATKGADDIEQAVRRTLAEGWRTRDIFNYETDDHSMLQGTDEIGGTILLRLQCYKH